MNHCCGPELTHAIDSEEIEMPFAAARERGNEGLIAKDPSSFYTPGRRGLAWIKLKKEFRNARRGHRGSRIRTRPAQQGPKRLYVRRARRVHWLSLTIGKAYSGLTDAEIKELTAKFLNLAVSRHGNQIEVEPAIVIEVAFDSIQESDRHASGLALRFPRIKRVRWDKSPGDVDTLAAARRLAGIAR